MDDNDLLESNINDHAYIYHLRVKKELINKLIK